MAESTSKEENMKNEKAKRERKIEIDASNPDYLLVNGNKIYVNEELRVPILEQYAEVPKDCGISQFASISRLPGLHLAVGLPDFHKGYALPIGSVAAIDLCDPSACVSPDGVGFDINCGVRCLKTNLTSKSLPTNLRNKLGDMLIQEVPLASKEDRKYNNINNLSLEDLNMILDNGMKYLLEMGIANEDDIECTESNGSLPGNSKLVSQYAKSRGLAQMGTLGEGNHYLEIQVVEKIFDDDLANKMGIFEDQILVSIHTGSRGLGHGCCEEILKEIKSQASGRMNKDEIKAAYKKISGNLELSKREKKEAYAELKDSINQKVKESKEEMNALMAIPYDSILGKKYVSVMFSASNYAWANRSFITHKARKCFRKLFPHASLDMVYDVCHNIAKIEKDQDGRELIVHRKGASRVLPPFHPDLPQRYQEIGQPVLVGGSMGTFSYLIVGADGCSKTCFSTCHGAGRLVTRSQSRQQFDYKKIVNTLNEKDIVFRSGSKEGMIEECSECYKDVNAVVDHSQKMGITKTVCRVKPVLVIKG